MLELSVRVVLGSEAEERGAEGRGGEPPAAPGGWRRKGAGGEERRDRREDELEGLWEREDEWRGRVGLRMGDGGAGGEEEGRDEGEEGRGAEGGK